MNKKLCFMFFILVFIIVIQNNELETKRKKYNKLRYNLEYNNQKIIMFKNNNNDLVKRVKIFEKELKDKIEEKNIWEETKKKIEKALS